ncbi:baseplate protein [Erwinia phage AH06]|nr:baseplate protein [Erwinia phage AH06]
MSNENPTVANVATEDDNAHSAIPEVDPSKGRAAVPAPTPVKETPPAGTDPETPADPAEEQPAEEEDAVEQPIDALYKDPFIEKLKSIEAMGGGDVMSIVHEEFDAFAALINEIDSNTDDKKILKEIISLYGAERALLWLSLASNAINNLSYRAGINLTIRQDGAQWLQGILLGDKVQGVSRPPVKTSSEGTKLLTGPQAVMRARAVMNMGDYIHIPLPHSGIWLTMLVAGDDEFVDMQTGIMAEKGVLGRRTNGMVFNNLDVVVRKHMSDFLLGMVTDSSLGVSDKKTLLPLIKEQDLDLIANAYLGARFKSGYNLVTACAADPKTCVHVEAAKVNISRLMIIDNSRLSATQRSHMSNFSGRTVEQVLAYQAAFEVMKDNVIEVGAVKFYLRVPSLEDKNLAGYAWINGIQQAITDSFNDSMTREQREQHINKQAALSSMRGYAHWITRIEFEDGSFVDSGDDIAMLLKQFSAKEEMRKPFFEKLNEFINRVTIGVVAVPRWTCPHCGKKQPLISKMFPAYTPLNVGRVFFTLMTNTLNQTFEQADI